MMLCHLENVLRGDKLGAPGPVEKAKHLWQREDAVLALQRAVEKIGQLRRAERHDETP